MFRPALLTPAFVLLGAVQVVLIATITVITVALPAIQADLRLEDADLVWVSSAYGLAFGGLLLLGGRLADLLGHRRILVAGLLTFGLGSAMAGTAPALWLLVVARFAQGAGAALAAPAAMALVSSLFATPAGRTRALAVWGVLAGVGASTGNVLSGLAVTWISWRWIFLVPAALALLAAVASASLLGRPAGQRQVNAPGRSGDAGRWRELDVGGAVLGTAGLGALTFGLGDLALGWIVIGAALLAAFAAVTVRSPSPLVPPAFLASPRRLVALAAIALVAGAMATAFFLLALHLQRVRGYSPLLASAVFVPPAIAVLGSGPAAARLLTRLRPQTVMAAGLVAAAAGLLLLAAVRSGAAGAALLFAGLVIFPFAAGLTFSGAMVAATRDAAPGQRGVAAGLANTAMEIGPPLGLALLVPRGYALAFGLAAAALAALAPITFLQHARRTT